jgi:hypothetical protein
MVFYFILFHSTLEHGCLFFLFIAHQIATLKHTRVKKPVFAGQSMRARAAIGGGGGGGGGVQLRMSIQ